MEITVKDLREQLLNYDGDLPLDFGGLEFYRLKNKGGFVHVEFNQTVYKNDEGKVIVENHK